MKELFALCSIGSCFVLLLAGAAKAHDVDAHHEGEGAGESAGEAALTSVHSNALNMTLVDSIVLEGVTDLYVAGARAYVGNRDQDVLHIVDISQPQAMRLDSSLSLLYWFSVNWNLPSHWLV